MKLFHAAGLHYVLSCFRLDAFPVRPEVPEDLQALQLGLPKLLCEDACWLSSPQGGVALSLERCAGPTAGAAIPHLLSVRCRDTSEQVAVTRHQACVSGLLASLTQNGYRFHELSFEEYRSAAQPTGSGVVWAVCKAPVRDCGLRSTYVSPPVVEEVDRDTISSILNGSGCTLSVQLLPAPASPEEQQAIVRNHTGCRQAVSGMLPNLQDPIAAAAADRWQYYSDRLHQPMTAVNLLISGPPAQAAMVTARVRSALRSSFTAISLDAARCRGLPIYSQPWAIAGDLARAAPALPLNKWTSEEAAHVFTLPIQSPVFQGLSLNPFSWLPETVPIPDALKSSGPGAVPLGRTAGSDTPVTLPRQVFLHHMAIFGKSGMRKTTLLKQLMEHFYRAHVPVLVLEPVKQEYRDLLLRHRSRVFTVEAPEVPLHINPFQVPAGVRLCDYRSSLISAFKAAISMPDPLPALLETAINEAYLLYGWTDQSRSGDPDVTVFGLAEFIRVFRRVIRTSSYSGEVRGNLMAGGTFRLQSLVERCAQTFDTCVSTDITDLLRGEVILELGRLEPEQKSLVAALVLISLLSWVRATRSSGTELKNILLIDEAHAFLDPGEGATAEEKALHSTMSQLVVNLITEVRAYGVGVLFSDQSPSRIGSTLTDNVGTLLSFRLSGQEAQLFQTAAGGGESTARCLTLLEPGEFLLSSELLPAPVPLRMNTGPHDREHPQLSNADLVRRQPDAQSRSARFRPYPQCRLCGCTGCEAGLRADARKYAAQLFTAFGDSLRKPEGLAGCIVSLHQALLRRGCSRTPDFPRLCRCTALQLVRRCAERGLVLEDRTLKLLLEELTQNIDKEAPHE